jgi:hypothetical protein
VKWVKTKWSLSWYRNQTEMCMGPFGRKQLRWWTVTSKHFMRFAMDVLHPLWPLRWTVITVTVRWHLSVICTSHPGVAVGLSKTSLANTSSTSRMFYFIFIKVVWIEGDYYWTSPVILFCYPWHNFIIIKSIYEIAEVTKDTIRLVPIERHTRIYDYKSSSNHISQCWDFIPAKIFKKGTRKNLGLCQMNFEFGKWSKGICLDISCSKNFVQAF